MSLRTALANVAKRIVGRSDAQPRADAQTGLPGEILETSAGKTEAYDWVSTLVKDGICDIENVDHRETMSELNPCMKLWIRDIAYTVWDNWFRFVDADGNPLDEMDMVQERLKELRLPEIMPRVTIHERNHGWAIIYKVYEGARLRTKTEEGLLDYFGDPNAFTDSPASPSRDIQWVEPVPTKSLRVDKVDDWNNPILLNYLSKLHGETPGGAKPVNVKLHATRCWFIIPRPKDRHWEGYKACSDIWDACVALNNHLDNMTWYSGKVGYYKEIWIKQGALNDAEAARMKTTQQQSGKRRFEMVKKGVWDEPKLLAPPVGASAFGEQMDKIFEIMSSGTGITSARWKGAQAGELEGSRTNLKLERAVISQIQLSYEPIMRAIIKDLFPGLSIDYEFEWEQSEQFDELEKAELKAKQAEFIPNVATVMTVKEIREYLGLPPEPEGPTLAEEQQEALQQLAEQTRQPSDNDNAPRTSRMEPAAPNRADAYTARDQGKFAAFVRYWEDRGYSRHEIIKACGMSKATLPRWINQEEAKESRQLAATL